MLSEAEVGHDETSSVALPLGGTPPTDSCAHDTPGRERPLQIRQHIL